MYRDGGGAEEPLEPRLRALHVAHVVERDLGDAAPAGADEPEIGEQILLAAEARSELQGPSTPEQTLPGKKRVPESPAHGSVREGRYDGCFVKFTFGACRASGGASKNG